ncbi:MAG: hypothetical protein LUI39_04925 [Lachnospiraceae bacterium]|nr:hypothetical protein [Lachnospiraceae bacterium]
MKARMKRILGAGMALAMTVSLFGSSISYASEDFEVQEAVGDYKICVFTLKATGSIVEAVDAFLGNVNSDLGFTYDVRFAGDDAATLLENVEMAIAEGYNGIISMTDKGNNAAILELCEESGVYFGGTWSNQASSLNSSDAGYDILKSSYYVGSIADGNDTYASEVAEYAAQIAAAYEALDDSEKEGSIGITTNPSKWTPGHQIAAQNMYETLTEEYGIPESAFATATLETRAEDETYAGVTLEAGTWQFPQVDVSSMALPTAYFQSNSNLQLICSFASITYIEPALQTANLHGKVKVWTCGYESEDYLMDNFGTEGDQTYQGFRTAPIEDVAFPLVQILDKLNGYSYADKAETVSGLVESMEADDASAKYQLSSYMIPYSSSIIVTDDEQFANFKDSYVYGNADGTCSIVTSAQLQSLMVTYNEEATYEDLVAFFDETGALTADALGE